VNKELLKALRDMLDRFAPTDEGLSEAEIACAARARAAIAQADQPLVIKATWQTQGGKK
jgi:hypothetical protein